MLICVSLIPVLTEESVYHIKMCAFSVCVSQDIQEQPVKPTSVSIPVWPRGIGLVKPTSVSIPVWLRDICLGNQHQ